MHARVRATFAAAIGHLAYLTTSPSHRADPHRGRPRGAASWMQRDRHRAPRAERRGRKRGRALSPVLMATGGARGWRDHRCVPPQEGGRGWAPLGRLRGGRRAGCSGVLYGVSSVAGGVLRVSALRARPVFAAARCERHGAGGCRAVLVKRARVRLCAGRAHWLGGREPWCRRPCGSRGCQRTVCRDHGRGYGPGCFVSLSAGVSTMHPFRPSSGYAGAAADGGHYRRRQQLGALLQGRLRASVQRACH